MDSGGHEVEGNGSDDVVGETVLRTGEANWRQEEMSRNDSGPGDGGVVNDSGEITHGDSGKSQNHFSDVLEEM